MRSFLLSINDTHVIRRIFRDYQIETEATSYLAAGGDKQKKVRELLISNFDPEIDRNAARPRLYSKQI